ncbi:RICIN domain-containing protein [Streptomyces sp. NPDC102270]|uniref:RICIN domain-containing protein n=1 Tax=Streptomyces sp. NPDC102270 TaxID=3366150 RepID=UPI00382A998F
MQTCRPADLRSQFQPSNRRPPNAWYVAVNRNSGKALDVAGGSSADGAAVTQ